MDAVGVIGAEAVRRICGGRDIKRRAARGFKGLHAGLCPLAFQHLPGGVIHGHAVFADDESIRLPQTLRLEARSTIITRGERVPDGEARFLPDDWDAIQVGNGRIAEARSVEAPKGFSTTPLMFFMAKVTPAML